MENDRETWLGPLQSTEAILLSIAENAASAGDIGRWLAESVEKGATHMLVVCDTFDYTNYPVTIMPDEDVRAAASKYDGKNMQKLMEVYWLGGSIDKQLAMRRSFTYGPESLEK